MREIKFRAWDKKEEAMFQVLDMHADMQTASCISEVNPYPYDQWNQPPNPGRTKIYEWLLDMGGEPIELMQYTGLKDRNGVEIYEGDVVSISYKEINGLKSFPESEGITYRVRYFSNISAFRAHRVAANRVDFVRGICSDMEYTEVIGNIYENSDLLEDA